MAQAYHEESGDKEIAGIRDCAGFDRLWRRHEQMGITEQMRRSFRPMRSRTVVPQGVIMKASGLGLNVVFVTALWVWFRPRAA